MKVRLCLFQNGLLSAMPYLVMWITSIVLGYVADKLLEKKIVGITNLRKILGTIGKPVNTS